VLSIVGLMLGAKDGFRLGLDDTGLEVGLVGLREGDLVGNREGDLVGTREVVHT